METEIDVAKQAVEKKVEEIIKTRSDHIEAMCAAFLKLTDIPVTDVELVEERSDTKYRWFFRRRQEKL